MDELNENFIFQSFDNLIKEGNGILKLIQELTPGESLTGDDIVKVNSWVKKSEKLIHGICPRYREYSIILQKLLYENKFSNITKDSFSDVDTLLYCLQGAYSDYKHEDVFPC